MITNPLPEISTTNNEQLNPNPIPTYLTNAQPKMQIVIKEPLYINRANIEALDVLRTTNIQYENLFGKLDKSEGNKLQLMTKRFNFNIIHYDDNMEKSAENQSYVSFFKTELSGTYYGVSNFNQFKYICSKIQKKSKNFILICSGSSAQKVFDYCIQNDINRIYIFFIFCFKKKNYCHLFKSFPKLKGIFTNFEDLKKILFSENPLIIKNCRVCSRSLILLKDYNDTYIKLHFEIVRKFSMYKLLKTNGEEKFME